MEEIKEYVWQNLSLSFASWSHGQKVGSLIGLIVAAVLGAVGWAGMAITQVQLAHYWPYALAIFFLSLVFIVTPFRMWQIEKKRAESIEATLRPALRCFFDKSSGCQHPTKVKLRDPGTGASLGSVRIRLFRIRVETPLPGGVKDCRANLLWLKRDNRLLFDHDALPLCIAPSNRPDPLTKDIRDKVPEHIDLFCVTEQNTAAIYPLNRSFPIAIHPDSLFTGPGEYLFHVVVSAHGVASSEINIALKWTGDWQTAEGYHVAS